MMKTILHAVSATSLALFCLPVGAVTMVNTINNIEEVVSGNTLAVYAPAGLTFIQFSPDKTWVADAANSRMQTKGVWRTSGGRVCVIQKSPLPTGVTPPEHCIEVGSVEFGKSWSAPSSNGQEINYKWLRGTPAIDL